MTSLSIAPYIKKLCSGRYTEHEMKDLLKKIHLYGSARDYAKAINICKYNFDKKIEDDLKKEEKPHKEKTIFEKEIKEDIPQLEIKEEVPDTTKEENRILNLVKNIKITDVPPTPANSDITHDEEKEIILPVEKLTRNESYVKPDFAKLREEIKKEDENLEKEIKKEIDEALDKLLKESEIPPDNDNNNNDDDNNNNNEDYDEDEDLFGSDDDDDNNNNIPPLQSHESSEPQVNQEQPIEEQERVMTRLQKHLSKEKEYEIDLKAKKMLKKDSKCLICKQKLKDPSNPRHINSKRHQAALNKSN